MDLVRPFLEKVVEDSGSKRIAAAQMGISERRLYNLLTHQEQMTEGLLDWILTCLDRPDLWYTEFAELLA